MKNVWKYNRILITNMIYSIWCKLMAYVKMHSYMKAYISYKVNKTAIYYAYINVLDLSCVGRKFALDSALEILLLCLSR